MTSNTQMVHQQGRSQLSRERSLHPHAWMPSAEDIHTNEGHLHSDDIVEFEGKRLIEKHTIKADMLLMKMHKALFSGRPPLLHIIQ